MSCRETASATRWSPRPPSPSRSNIDRARPPALLPALLIGLALAAAAGNLVAGCGQDPTCGPEDAPADGLRATAAAQTVRYGGVTSSPNNDCPPAEGGPTSLTVEATQVDPAVDGRQSVVLCLPRPAEIGPDPIELADTRLVELVDVSARLDDECSLRIDYDQPATGTLTFLGYCDDGGHPAGYAITVAGSVGGRRICDDGTGPTEEAVTVTLDGTFAVEALQF